MMCSAAVSLGRRCVADMMKRGEGEELTRGGENLRGNRHRSWIPSHHSLKVTP